MRPRAIILPIFLATLVVLPASAGVEVVMKSKIDIPGAQLKILGKDFSQSEQRFLVDDAATIKGTVSGDRTNWIDLKREAFFDETKRGCTVTTFAEMEERLKAMQGEESPFKFMGGSDEDGPQRDPQEFDVRVDSRVGPPVTVAGLTGKSTQIEVEVVDKESGEVVSKIDIDNVYSDSAELKLLQKFDRKLAERQVKAMGAALGMDFDAMRGRIMGRPEMHKAMEEMRKAGIGENQAVVRTVTRITATRPPAGEEQGAETTAAAAETTQDEPKKRGRLAQRMMAKMKERQDRKKAAKRTDTDASGEPKPMSFSSELQSFRSGVEVALSQACVEAYKKKKK